MADFERNEPINPEVNFNLKTMVHIESNSQYVISIHDRCNGLFNLIKDKKFIISDYLLQIQKLSVYLMQVELELKNYRNINNGRL